MYCGYLFVSRLIVFNLCTAGGKSLSRTACGQALLVCAWRTVKEVSLFFGEISGWLKQRIDACMADTLSEMGNHLKQLLLETIHRGAFEQVYCGFSLLCASLWSCRSPQLQQMPSCWLAGLIDDLADDSNQPANYAPREGVPACLSWCR